MTQVAWSGMSGHGTKGTGKGERGWDGLCESWDRSSKQEQGCMASILNIPLNTWSVMKDPFN